MEEKKSNSGIIICMAIIIVVLSILCVLFATGKLVLTDNQTNNKADTQEEKEPEKEEVVKVNYSDYIGTWNNTVTQDEFIIHSASDTEITFTWNLYRLTSVENATIPMTNGKGSYYFQGNTHDYSSGVDTPFKRKATIQLTDQGIDVLVEDVDQIGNDYKLLTGDGDWSFFKPNTYTHPNRANY